MRIGLIGAGNIAQIMHLPYLVELPEAEVHAIADPGRNVVEALGDRYNIPNQYEDSDALIEELADDLDGVVIATPMHTHAETAIAALEADLHTFVEKPVAVTPEDAADVVEAADATDAVCMVGYMKRYDSGYQRFAEEVENADTIDLITNTVIPPDVGSVIEEVYDNIPADLDESFLQASGENRTSQLQTAIDTDDDTLAHAYGYHLESICHDINALRGLFGDVESIDHVDVFNDWKYLTAQLQYEGGRRCTLQSGATDRKWYDERIRVDTPESALSIEFSNAFIKNTPSEVRIEEGTDEMTATEHTPSYDESFKRELAYFLDCMAGDAEVRTGPREAKKDVELIADLFRSYQNIDRVGEY
ncbi:Gfo/Idh/MocA family protein [Haloarcula nitratireducens]|uniref:Gfo/Idh/MocA family oxidoreductase n=1 Tax=Haloarcula nitratireducens TaxID=2487749 RepID=A0AAW4PH76_9EURY|nr:Gfo/Idh/MocA family oxidoreductase [Halomicroarcula nitratireducens]MBX0296876.1 Gfo/Idh/MocA family oxidoreductase [Halomicroarcula nitratireducens]